MKNIAKSIMAVCAAVSLTACTSGSSAAASTAAVFSNPGTYSATASGRNGDVTVTLTVTESEITSIEVESEETETIGVSAMNSLTETIIANQSLAVDSVSGATLSCDAYFEALNDCIEQAGGDLEALNGEIAAVETEYTTEADIIVVGAGAAGMTAAVTASNNGKTVILLEKSSSVGGNTLCAANGINALDSDVQLASEDYQNAETSLENFVELHTNDLNKDDLSLVETLAEASGETINYFTGLGVELAPEISDDSRNSSSNPYLLKEANGESTAVTLINAISGALDETDVILYKNMDATTLVQDETGRVTGVTATDENGNEVTFSGNAVLLTTGGFGQNQELIAEANPSLAGAITDEQAPTTGEGLLMAEAVGAGTVDLGEIQTFPSVISGYGMFMSFGLWNSGDAILVNADGDRFVKEQFEVPSEILAQEGSLAYGIFDADNYNDNYQNMIDNGFMFTADNLDDLAAQLGIDAEGLKAAVEQWNADAETGTDTVYGRENLTTIEGTYYGYIVGVGAHYFMGGITINSDTQVLDTEGNVIEGLYAAGEVTGGLHGSQRVDGTGLADSFVMGRVAGNVLSAE